MLIKTLKITLNKPENEDKNHRMRQSEPNITHKLKYAKLNKNNILQDICIIKFKQTPVVVD
jgi:hypothetical protein